jgi:O-methyltransferase
MIETLLQRYPIISDQIETTELRILLQRLEQVLHNGVAGDVVEFGCYVGTSSLFFERMLAQYAPARQLHVYDSFAGLPAKQPQDVSPVGEQFSAGKLKASKTELINNFKQAGLRIPHIHRGWFADLTTDDIPGRISFAFLDGDFYESILTPLQLIWPQLSPGAIVIIDDYQSEALPGARRAVNDWTKRHPAKVRVEQSLAILELP